MSADIGGMVFFEWLLEDGEIDPDLGDKRLQEEVGQLSDDTGQFTTETIPKIMIFMTIFLFDHEMKSLYKQLQRGVKMQFNYYSYLFH